MESLYLIGNGFDLHHEIPSSYQDFHLWLVKNKNRVACQLDGIYVTSGPWWHDFETSLGAIDINGYVDGIKEDTYPDIRSDEYRDRDRFVMPDTAENELMILYANVRDSFFEWVASLALGASERKIKIETNDSFFISFNYTDTLNSLYSIEDDSICYIHGKASRGDGLILGHGKTCSEILDSAQQDAPRDLVDADEIRKWHDTHYDPIIDETIRIIAGQVAEQMKNTEEIIACNSNSFNQIATVSNIYVYGLSFSPIDTPYLDQIMSKIDTNRTQWEISYFSEIDMSGIESYMQRYRIAQNLYSLIKLEDRCVLRQGLLFD